MRFLLLVLAFCPLAIACPSYPYHDFTWASDYHPPVRPPDTLLDNCYSLGIDKAICGEATNANLTETQRKQLILDALVNESGPNHQRAESWNDGLIFTNYPPRNVTPTSSGSIRDAWLKIISLTPSVYEEGNLLINDSGKLKNKFSFSFVVERKAFAGDCATTYDICGYDYALETFQDGVRIGTGLQVPFNETGGAGHPNEFSTSLAISSEYQIAHYELVTHCTSGPEGEFCWTTCDYSHMDDIKDNLVLTDNKTANYYGFLPLASSIVDSYERGVADVWVFAASNKDFGKYVFRIGNSYLETKNRQYSFMSELAPYNVITPEASISPSKTSIYGLAVMKNENVTMNGSEFGSYLARTEPFLYSFFLFFGANFSEFPLFHGQKVHLLAPTNALNCSLTIYSHFRTDEYPDFCVLTNQTPVLSLSVLNRTNGSITIGVEFKDNSTGQPLPGKEITLEYGSHTVNVTTSPDGSAGVVFPYNAGAGTVTAEFKTDFQTKSAEARLVIPPWSVSISGQMVEAVVLFLFGTVVYGLVRRAWG